MTVVKIGSIAVLVSLLTGCSSWMEEHERAMDRARAHQWNEMMDKHHNEPGATGPKWQIPNAKSQSYLTYLEQLTQQNIDGLMQASDGLNCQLDDVTSSFVMHQMTPEAIARVRQSTADLVQTEQRGQSITVLSGDCAQGKLNGPVSAVYTDNSYSRTEFFSGETQITGRIDGHFKDGVLHGEARVITIDRSNFNGSWRELRYFNIGVYDNGKPVGDHVNVAGNDDGRSVTVTQHLEQNRALINSWMNGRPNTRYHTLNGQIDGWMEFASAVLKDSPSCYRAGKQLPVTAYCHQIAPSLAQLKRVEAPADYARVESLGEVATAPVSRTPDANTTAASSASAESVTGGAWNVPAVGFYSWLKPPSNATLASANAASYMPKLTTILAGDVAAQLTPGSQQECVLDADTKSYILFQLTADEHAAQRTAQRKHNFDYDDGAADIIVSQGQCTDGTIQGRFVAHYTHPHRFSTGAYQQISDMYGRVEGQFIDGRLHGELKRIWLQQAKSGSMAATDVGASLVQFNNGQRVQDELQLLAIPNSRSTRVIKTNYRSDGREKLEIWLNGKRQISSVMRNGLNDGFIKYHDPALNNLEQCYRDGVVQQSNSYCQQVGF